MAANQGCSGHEKHLCSMVESKEDHSKIKQYVKNAKFICKTCGRASAKDENVCAPEKL